MGISHQDGYTLIELMVASALGLMLFGAMMWIMVHIADMLDTSFATSELLHEARTITHMLNDGSYPNKTVSNPTANTWIPSAASSRVNLFCF
ncbi:MAG: prepilin-type N-terminal cleavage/methylation domain-containing protein [Magnetococcales bacterium]|nr:prepilin-type N-terminal cleavage/methylation domain-containing protein [Magnetococcales bacterium]